MIHMSIFKKYISALIKFPLKKDEETHEITAITAKEKQSTVIKEYLKPIFKQNGYLTNGQTWWKERADFFIIINLQNFSWNTRNDITFCFNIGVGLKKLMKDSSQKPRYADLSIFVRDDAYLPDTRKVNSYKNNTGYIINQSTDIDKFIDEIRKDFEDDIFPKMEKLVTLNDCMEHYEQFQIEDRFKKVIEAANKVDNS